MPQIITLSHANGPEEQRLPCSLLYVKQCADDKVDLVVLAHHTAAWKTDRREQVSTHTQ